MEKNFTVVLLDHHENFDFVVEKKIWNDLPFTILIERSNDENYLSTVCTRADVIGVSLTNVTKKMILSMQRCKAIIRYGIGLDTICVKTAKEKNIPIINFPNYCIEEVAEHAVALSMSLLRMLPTYHAALQQQQVWPLTKNIPPLKTIRECTIGVVGFGKTGRSFAKKMFGLGAKKVLVFSRRPPEDLLQVIPNAQWVPNLEDIFAKSDLISLHLPSTDLTKGIVSKKYIQLMKIGSILINVARGDLVREEDLIQALQENHIFAGLDVFLKEPLSSEHPFLQMDRVLLSPHLAWNSQLSLQELQQNVANTIKQIYLENIHGI